MYKVTISDGTILSKCIQNVSFDVVTPSEYDMRNIVRNSMTITGTIDTDEKTVSLYQWALLKGNNPDCYKEVTIEHYQKNVLVRKVHYSKAFVVDYAEQYSKSEGVGTFSIYLRQFYKQDIDVFSPMTSASLLADSSVVENEADEENVDSVQNIHVDEKATSPKALISFTDRLEMQKKSSSAINEYIAGTRKFDNDVLQEYSNLYSELVNSNEVWSWDEDIPNGENLLPIEKKKIKENAIKIGLIKEVPVKKVEGQRFGYADFKGAGVVIDELDLPEELWLEDDNTQFKALNLEIKKKRPDLFPSGYVGIKGRFSFQCSTLDYII